VCDDEVEWERGGDRRRKRVWLRPLFNTHTHTNAPPFPRLPPTAEEKKRVDVFACKSTRPPSSFMCTVFFFYHGSYGVSCHFPTILMVCPVFLCCVCTGLIVVVVMAHSTAAVHQCALLFSTRRNHDGFRAFVSLRVCVCVIGQCATAWGWW
jgi:hypothetical protein